MAEDAARMTAIEQMGRLLLEADIGRKLGLQPNDLRAGLDVARHLLDRGSPDKAMRIYAAMVLVEPSVADYQLGLANCAIVLEEHYLAIQAAAAAIVLAPADPRGYFLSGKACLAVGERDEARQDLADALALARKADDRLVAEEAGRLLRSLETALA